MRPEHRTGVGLAHHCSKEFGFYSASNRKASFLFHPFILSAAIRLVSLWFLEYSGAASDFRGETLMP